MRVRGPNRCGKCGSACHISELVNICNEQEDMGRVIESLNGLELGGISCLLALAGVLGSLPLQPLLLASPAPISQGPGHISLAVLNTRQCLHQLQHPLIRQPKPAVTDIEYHQSSSSHCKRQIASSRAGRGPASSRLLKAAWTFMCKATISS